MLLLNVIIITVAISGDIISGEDCNGAIHAVTFQDLYNGIDPKNSGPSTDIVAKNALYLSGVLDTMVTVGDVIEVVFNTRELIDVRRVSLTSNTAGVATLTLKDKKDVITTRTVQKQVSTNTFSESFSGIQMKSLEIKLSSYTGDATQADIADIQLNICVSPCSESSVQELKHENLISDLSISTTSSEIPDATKFMKGSGAVINPATSQDMFAVTTDTAVVTIEFVQPKDVVEVTMETIHIKSVQLKYFDVNNKRLNRDTVVVANRDVVETVTQRPVTQKLVGVKSIKIEFRNGDYEKIGIQNLVVKICSAP